MFLGKKGTAQDVLFIAVIVFALAIGFFTLYFMANQAYDKMINNSVINSSQPTIDVLNAGKAMTNKLDYVFFAIFIGFILSLMVSSYFIGGNPLFMFIYFIIVVIGVILSIVLSYVWDLVSGSSIFGSSVLSFPLTNNIMQYLPYYIAVIGIVGMILMFAKPYFSQENQGGGGY